MQTIGQLAPHLAAQAAVRASSPNSPALLPISDPEKVPAVWGIEDRAIEDRTVSYREGEWPGVPVLRRALRADEGVLIARRVADLRRATAPDPNVRNNPSVHLAVATMLGGFAQRDKLGEEEIFSLVLIYIDTARDVPPWAIVRAADAIRAGETTLPRAFVPSTADFTYEAKRLLEPYTVALARLESFSRARVHEHEYEVPRRPPRYIPRVEVGPDQYMEFD